MNVSEQVRIDTNNELWGRVTGLGTIIEVRPHGWLVVAAEQIGSDIIVHESEAIPV